MFNVNTFLFLFYACTHTFNNNAKKIVCLAFRTTRTLAFPRNIGAWPGSWIHTTI